MKLGPVTSDKQLNSPFIFWKFCKSKGERKIRAGFTEGLIKNTQALSFFYLT